MNVKMVNRNVAIGALVSGLLLSGSVLAQPVDAAPGYLKDRSGNIVRTGSGGCAHTGNWTPEMATVVGCDGASLNLSLERVEGQGSGIDKEVLVPLATLFEFDSAELTEAGKRELQTYRDSIAPELAQVYGGVVVGHTDSQGPAAYNQGLSERRAEAVRDYLVGLGVPADKLIAVGGGQDYPIAANDSDAGQQLNRRVAIGVSGELRNDDAMTLPSAALFEPNSATLSAAGEQQLKGYGDEVKGSMGRISRVEIVGHTDNRAAGEAGEQLALARAETLRDHLVLAGVPADLIEIHSAGADSPVASNRTTEGRAENRRVDIYLSGRAS